jgi:hypothetical protein
MPYVGAILPKHGSRYNPIGMIRTWVKADTALRSPRDCIRYDFGDYEGWLDGDQWICWRILSTVQENMKVIQTLEKMPETVQVEGPLDRVQVAGWAIESVY